MPRSLKSIVPDPSMSNRQPVGAFHRTSFSISPVFSTSHLENFLNVTLEEGSPGDPPGPHGDPPGPQGILLYSCLDLLPQGPLGYPRGAKPPWYPRSYWRRSR